VWRHPLADVAAKAAAPITANQYAEGKFKTGDEVGGEGEPPVPSGAPVGVVVGPEISPVARFTYHIVV
jgi:hypothetical protein